MVWGCAPAKSPILLCATNIKALHECHEHWDMDTEVRHGWFRAVLRNARLLIPVLSHGELGSCGTVGIESGHCPSLLGKPNTLILLGNLTQVNPDATHCKFWQLSPCMYSLFINSCFMMTELRLSSKYLFFFKTLTI